MDIVVRDSDGSLGEVPRVASGRGVVPLMGSAAVEAGMRAGNINVSAPASDTMDLSAASLEAQEKHAAVMLRLEATRRARTIYVPVEAEEVKRALRALGHPVTLFGEGPGDRRDRLRILLAEADVNRAAASGSLVMSAASAVGGAVPSSAALAAAAAAATAASTATAAGGAFSGPASAASAAAAAAALAAAAASTEQFYTPASEALCEARRTLAAFSWERSARRLRAAADVATSLSACATEDAHAARLYSSLKRMRPVLSQAADDRPVTAVALSHDATLLATGGWSGAVRVWRTAALDAPAAATGATTGHADRAVGVAWHPAAGVGLGSAAAGADAGHHHHLGRHGVTEPQHLEGSRGLLASASADGTARLWRMPAAAGAEGRGMEVDASGAADGVGASSSDAAAAAAAGTGDVCPTLEAAGMFSGHASRLACVAFHPCGAYLGTTSYDRTWRLWDVETQRELLLQEGHSREVYALAFHRDGSLAATGDLGGTGRVWDLRSGKSVMLLQGHAKQLLSLDFSPNGHHLASGSDDNTAIIWELRQQRALYTIPAHKSLVKAVKFAPVSGEYLLTASYDGTLKTWCARDWAPLAVLAGHDNKITAVDIAAAPMRASLGKAPPLHSSGGIDGGGDAEGRSKAQAHPAEAAIVSVGFDRTMKIWA